MYSKKGVRKVGGRRYSKPKRRMAMYRKPAALSKKYQKVKYFTEMFKASDLQLGPGGTAAYGLKFNTRLNDCPNNVQYKGLFGMYTITRFDVLIYPISNYVVTNNFNTTTGGIAPPSITYEVNRDGNEGSPGTESAILQTSFARRRNISGVKPIVIKVFNPRPWLTQGEGGTVTGFTTADVSGKKWIWLDTNGSAPADVTFNGVRAWIQSGATALTEPVTIANIYYRVYYAFKEQT